MTKGSKSRVEIQANKDIALAKIYARAAVWKAGFAALWRVVLAVSIAVIFYVIAGKTTSFSAVVNAVFSFDVSKYGFMTLSAILGYGWRRERVLRKKEVAELSASHKNLELLIDPKRSSSKLSPEGTPVRVLSQG